MQSSLQNLRLILSATSFAVACTLVQCLSAFAANVNLAWDPKTDSGLAGYKVYYGTSSRSYGTPINVGNVTTYTVTGLNSGTYYFTVTAYYTSGSETGFSNEVSTTVTSVTPDSTPPTITLTSPSNGSSISGTVTVSANASDNIGVAGVQFMVDGLNWGSEDTSAPYSVSWNTSTAANGTHTLTARARDAAGNQTNSTAITVNVSNTTPDSTPPTITLTSPGNGSSVSGTVTVSANASDNIGVAGVQFMIDGANLGSEDTNAPYSVSWDTATFANGTHTLIARARDAAGNQTNSTAITLNASNTETTRLTGLLAAYALNENSGTTAGDSSGNSNTGSISGASWSSGKFGNALFFDGVSSVVNVNDSSSLQPANGMTLEAWVYPTSSLAGWKSVLRKEGDAYFLYASSNQGNVPAVGGHFGSVSNYQIAFGTSPLPTNTWTHLAASYDGSVLRLFVNGSQVSSLTVGGPIRNDLLPLRIGNSTFPGECFPGAIDEVRIYGQALTQSGIQNDMNSPIGGTTSTPSLLPAPTNVSVK